MYTKKRHLKKSENVKKQGTLLWDEIFRLEYPHAYYVDLSERLIDYKLKMLEETRMKITVVGLGVIGGSFVKAQGKGYEVPGIDTSSRL